MTTETRTPPFEADAEVERTPDLPEASTPAPQIQYVALEGS